MVAEILIVVLAVSLVIWFVNSVYFPVPGIAKQIITIAVGVFFILWILDVSGIFHSGIGGHRLH